MPDGIPPSADRQEPLLALLRCPDCTAPLRREDGGLVCEGGGHRFPIVEGVPVMLDEATLAADPQYEHQRQYFDSRFAAYQRYELERWRVSFLQRLRAADALGGEGAPLIDVGVGGSGYTVIEAAREGRLAVGCDLSLEGLVVAKRLAEEEGLADRTLFVCCSAERLPFTDDAFDVALAIAVIEHVPDDRATISEIARVLARGGRAWITVPHSFRNFSPVFWPPNWLHDRRLGHLRRYDAESLASQCRTAGLAPTAVQFTGHAIKVLQIVLSARMPARVADRVWWWCERRDLSRRGRRRGSMQLSMALRKP